MVKNLTSTTSGGPARTGSPVRWMLPAAAAMVLISTVACTSSKPPASGGTPEGSTGSSAVAAGSSAAGAASATSAPAISNPSSSSSGKAPSKDVIAGLIAFRSQLSFSGPKNLSMSFSAFPGVTSPKSSCAHIGAVGTPVAKGRARQFRIPSPPYGGDVTITAEISPYHGPGTYRKASLITAGPSIVVDGSSYNLRAVAATVTISVSATGSGEISFSQAAATRASQPALSGAIKWTCVTQS